MSFEVKRVRRSNNPFFGGIFMIVIGAGLALILSRTLLADAADSETWPSVTGTVVTSEVETNRSGDGNSYSARIIYDYTVDGETYRAGKVTVMDGSSSRSAPARDLVEQYPVGSAVEVFYNPDVPEDAILQPGATGVLRWLYRGGLVIAFFGAWITIRSIFRLIFRLFRR